MIPQRIRLSRARGFDLQAASLALNGLPAVNCARPGPLGNPFVVGKHSDRIGCVEYYDMLIGAGLINLLADVDAQIAARDYLAANLDSLRGKNCACWCRLDGKPCHASTILRVANA